MDVGYVDRMASEGALSVMRALRDDVFHESPPAIEVPMLTAGGVDSERIEFVALFGSTKRKL